MVKKLYFVFFMIFMSFPAVAQEKEDLDIGEQEDVESVDADLLEKIKTLKVKKLSDLVHLSPFSDVAVIQRRFMPKTGRASLSLASTFNLSSEFFFNPGVESHLTYHFLEKHGLELSGYYTFTFNRGVLNDMNNIGINATEKLPIAKSFFGLAYKWMPVYGKIAFYNKRVLAFDTLFNFGGGFSGIKKKGSAVKWEPAMIAGIGQVFAITRDLGLRWDLRWHMTVRTQANPVSILNDILFSIGLSYYYPSAGRR